MEGKKFASVITCVNDHEDVGRQLLEPFSKLSPIADKV